MEKRNIIEEKRTPGIKQAAAEEDRLTKSSGNFNKERVTNGQQRTETTKRSRS